MSGPYSEVPYRGFPHPQTHPARLAVLAILHGLKPAPIGSGRVLEIGCGDGANLVPMAYELPGSRFLGLDLEKEAIDEARSAAAALALENIEFQVMDLAGAAGLGEFDYVLAHGVYSWVAASTRGRLLALCRESLARHGIAYISYNALPGGRIRQMLAEIMRFHVRAFDSAAERLEQARAIAEFLAATGSAAVPPAELERLRAAPDWLIYHDDLAEISEFFYLHEFLEDASEHGLQFLAEADFFEMYPPGLTTEAGAILREMEAQDVILKEQYLDFLTARRFRQTLLCHVEHTLDRSLNPARLRPLWAALPRQPVSGATEELTRLAGLWPRRLPVSETGIEPAVLLRLFQGGVLELHTTAGAFSTGVSDYPRASAAARYYAGRGETVVPNLRHEAVDLQTPGAAATLLRLDGSVHRSAFDGEDLTRFLRLALLHGHTNPP